MSYTEKSYWTKIEESASSLGLVVSFGCSDIPITTLYKRQKNFMWIFPRYEIVAQNYRQITDVWQVKDKEWSDKISKTLQVKCLY